jgi:hypothetical protein
LPGKEHPACPGRNSLAALKRDKAAVFKTLDANEQLKGSLSQKNCENPSAFERAQYMRAISRMPTR